MKRIQEEVKEQDPDQGIILLLWIIHQNLCLCCISVALRIRS